MVVIFHQLQLDSEGKFLLEFGPELWPEIQFWFCCMSKLLFFSVKAQAKSQDKSSQKSGQNSSHFPPSKSGPEKFNYCTNVTTAEEIVWLKGKMWNLHNLHCSDACDDDLLCLNRFACRPFVQKPFLHTSHYSRIVTQFATHPVTRVASLAKILTNADTHTMAERILSCESSVQRRAS